MAGEQRCLVSQSSASSCLPQGASSDHSIPLNCAHSDLVKFSLGDAEYAKVLHTLRELCRRVLQRVSRTQGMLKVTSRLYYRDRLLICS
jgi:hypothetical protein